MKRTAGVRTTLRSHGTPGRVSLWRGLIPPCQEKSVELQVPPREAETGRLRSEFVTFLSSGVVRGRKAPKSICQQASPRSFDSAP